MQLGDELADNVAVVRIHAVGVDCDAVAVGLGAHAPRRDRAACLAVAKRAAIWPRTLTAAAGLSPVSFKSSSSSAAAISRAATTRRSPEPKSGDESLT